LNAVKKYIAEGEPFFLTYGDSVSDVPIPEIEKSHLENPNHVVTVTAVDKGERFGVLQVTDGKITGFSEKSSSKKQLINGGFIACDYTLFDEVNENSGDLSFETLTNLANEGRMNLYYHDGFWHAMDTQKDVDDLNKIYSQSPELFGY
jgi:glucose-1-phosphate cytidylyltransferase